MNGTAALAGSGQMAVTEYSALQREEKTRKANYGRTVGEPQLSEQAEKYYNELKRKYGNMEFILVSRYRKEQTRAQAGQYGSPGRMAVQIDEDKIEQMAGDENYRKHYEGIIQNAAANMSMAQKKLGSNADCVKSMGMNVKEGLPSFFAAVDKALDTVTVTASSRDELIRKINDVISADGTQEGVRLDITGAIQEMYRRQAERVNESGKGSGEPLHDIGKLMEVARRIARGDKVPQRDEKKLMEYSSDLYQMAKSAAVLNARKKHKKHKSLYKDEDKSSIEEKIRELNREEISKSNNSL